MIDGVKRFFDVSGTARVMLAVLGGLFALLLAAGLAVTLLLYAFESPLPYLVGLALGFLLSALKVVLLDKSIHRSMDLESGQAKNYASLQFILRYGLTILFLLGAVFLPRIVGLIGVIVGILALQISAYITSLVLKRRSDLI